MCGLLLGDDEVSASAYGFDIRQAAVLVICDNARYDLSLYFAKFVWGKGSQALESLGYELCSRARPSAASVPCLCRYGLPVMDGCVLAQPACGMLRM